MKNTLRIVEAEPRGATATLRISRPFDLPDPCPSCRKLRRENAALTERVEQLLAALRRESHHIDTRASNTGR